MARRPICISLATVMVVTAGLVASCSNGESSTDTSDRLDQGIDAQNEGDLEKAEDAYRDVLRDDSENVAALYDLGLVHQLTDRNTDAEENYRKALVIDPNFAPALFNLAILRTQAGAPDEAIELYERVTTVEPENAAAHYNLALLLQSLGRSREAERSLTKANQLDPRLISDMSSADVDAGRPIGDVAEPESSPR